MNERTRHGGLRVLCMLAVVCALAIAGCGRAGPETIAVHGRVTFGGGPCPGGGTVYFTPVAVAEGMPLRPAVGDFAADGHFDVTSFADGDGLIPGEYSVRIVCWKNRPQGYDQPGENAVPRDFKPENLLIESGTRGVVRADYDVPIRPE